jgi:hypothetical protein
VLDGSAPQPRLVFDMQAARGDGGLEARAEVGA